MAEFILPETTPTSIKFKYKRTYKGAGCCECGKPAVRHVGKKGWCKAHVEGAFAARRAQMRDPLIDEEVDRAE